MNEDLPAEGGPLGQSMRISVPGEKQPLENKHANRSNGRSASEKRQDLLSEQQLDLEDEKRAGEDRDSKRRLIQEDHG